MSPEIVEAIKRQRTFWVATGIALTIGWTAYSGTQGLDQLLERRSLIQQLEEQNTTLQRENEQRKLRIDRLNGDSSEQDMELRKLNKAKPGDLMFILPPDKSTSDHPDPAAPTPQ
jgi:cell division protein FtsB